MDWKTAAITYGSTTAKLRAMNREEWDAYFLKWYSKTIEALKVRKPGEADFAKWHGFKDALLDEEDRRANGTADTDPWLEEVLRYLYEEKEVPHA